LGDTCVFLDLTHLNAGHLLERFPNIYNYCIKAGYDMTRDPLPCVPAAHYFCGGVAVDQQAKTELPGLMAIGETAWTGLHGANRLASNSLLEALALADHAAQYLSDTSFIKPKEFAPWDSSRVMPSSHAVMIHQTWHALRHVMNDYVGIVRNTQRLKQASTHIELMSQEIRDYYSRYRLSRDLVELRNLNLCAQIVILSAMERKESRGLHYTEDYLHRDNEAYDTFYSLGIVKRVPLGSMP
jgi:L-aspartate oxidase